MLSNGVLYVLILNGFYNVTSLVLVFNAPDSQKNESNSS